MLSSGQVISLAVPVFLLSILAEYLWGRKVGRDTYRLNDAISSVGLGVLSQATGVLTTPVFEVATYAIAFRCLNLLPQAAAFWNHPAGWVSAIVLYDFLAYWMHRKEHEVAIMWASHVVHHQSQDYNLSTALRHPLAYPFDWVFFIPMAVLGVPPDIYAIVAMINLLFQFWVHTEHIGRLGWFDRVFASPSVHRVHHAINPRYIDKNYGCILSVWDRAFGTYAAEDPQEPCIYGVCSPLDSWDPVRANLQVFAILARDSWYTRSWFDKVRVWLASPSWRPADVAARFPRRAFGAQELRRYDATPISARARVLAGAGCVAALLAMEGFLWLADDWPLPIALLGLMGLWLLQWMIGRALEGQQPAPRSIALLNAG